MKSRIIIIVLLAALVVVSALGATAYFSSTSTGAGTIKSGTLTMYLSTDGTSWGKNIALPWDVSELAPGETKDGYLYMKNTGSIDAKTVVFDFHDILNNPNLASHIFIVDIQDNLDGSNQIAAFAGYDSYPYDGNISLVELAANTPDGYSPTNQSQTFLPKNGGIGWLYMKLQLDPALNDDFQGITTTYGLTVKAQQMPFGQQ